MKKWLVAGAIIGYVIVGLMFPVVAMITCGCFFGLACAVCLKCVVDIFCD